MEEWCLDFITEENFSKHVELTIDKYVDKMESYNLAKFNSNYIDPIKFIFDKTVYRTSWEDVVNKEVIRQRDKGNNNDIGYFHQGIFQYIENCHVPKNGKEGGWDVIYSKTDGIELPDGTIVHKIYVEMKNKHNTMNSASAGKTYIKMQNQLLNDDDCACFLVEAIAQRSQNIKWETTVDGRKVSHKKIRRVSIDQFYSLVTGEENAFFQMCMVLPVVIEQVVSDKNIRIIEEDTVLTELTNMADDLKCEDKELSMNIAICLLGFPTYSGFLGLEGKLTVAKNPFMSRVIKYSSKLDK